MAEGDRLMIYAVTEWHNVDENLMKRKHWKMKSKRKRNVMIL